MSKMNYVDWKVKHMFLEGNLINVDTAQFKPKKNIIGQEMSKIQQHVLLYNISLSYWYI